MHTYVYLLLSMHKRDYYQYLCFGGAQSVKTESFNLPYVRCFDFENVEQRQFSWPLFQTKHQITWCIFKKNICRETPPLILTTLALSLYKLIKTQHLHTASRTAQLAAQHIQIWNNIENWKVNMNNAAKLSMNNELDVT